MDSRVKDLITRKGLIVDISLAAIWFAVFSVILRPYVPSTEEPVVTIAATMTASCLTGVFWLVLCMFRLVRMDHKHPAKREDE